MGPKQSLPQDTSASASAGRGVRTGTTNSALVRNFDHLFGSHLAGDGADHAGGGAATNTSTPARSPRTSVSGHESDSQLGSQGSGSAHTSVNPDAAAQLQQDHQAAAATAAAAKRAAQQELTTPLCLRYKFQPPRSNNQQQQQAPPQNKTTPPLPPAPTQGVTVDLFDGDGRPVRRLTLNKSDGEFFAVVPVQMPRAGEPALVQYYRFNVDGRPGVCHPHLPQNALPGSSSGEPANYVAVENPETELRRAAAQKQPPQVGKDGVIVGGAPAAAEDDSGWGQVPPQFEETRKFPPIMPPHLRYTPLNAPPSQFRCDADGNVVPVTDEGAAVGPEQRPAPLSVTVGHVYFQRREDHTLVGTTVRIRDKFATIAFYKHDPVPAGAVAMPGLQHPPSGGGGGATGAVPIPIRRQD